jgi:hypothetical protein
MLAGLEMARRAVAQAGPSILSSGEIESVLVLQPTSCFEVCGVQC